jgi:hypothetical protein
MYRFFFALAMSYAERVVIVFLSIGRLRILCFASFDGFGNLSIQSGTSHPDSFITFTMLREDEFQCGLGLF